MKQVNLSMSTLIMLIVFLISGCTKSDDLKDDNIIATYKNGIKYKIGEINLTVVQGNYYEMGRQYGELLKDEIEFMYTNSIDNPMIKGGVATFEELKQEAVDNAWAGFPHALREIFRGMSETSGIEINKLVLLDQSMTAAVMHISEAFGVNGFGMCSCLTTWGDYTKNGNTVVGRNFDWLNLFTRCSSAFGVVIFKPDDGSVETALIGYAGWVNAMTAINENGLFLETNSGLRSAGLEILPDRTPYLNELFTISSQSEDLEFMSNRLTTIRPNMGMLVNICDKNHGFCFESNCYQTKIREADIPGLLVTTNEFRLESWQLEITESESHSVRRWENLNDLAAENKGQIDEKVMMSIMDEPLHLGNGIFGKGATKQTLEPNDVDVTVHQIVAVPGKKKIWLKVPGHIEWTLIDLNNFFTK